MPKKKFASWESSPNFRWVKMIGGKRHRITCKQLGLTEPDWTKERSWDKAKAYFDALEATLKQTVLEPEAKQLVEQLDKQLQFAKGNKPSEVAKLEATKATIEAEHFSIDGFVTDNTIEQTIKTIELLGGKITLPDGLTNQQLSMILGQGKVVREQLKQVKQVETSFTLKHQADRFLELASKSQEVKTATELKGAINRLVERWGESFDIRTIAESQMDDIYNFVIEADWQSKNKKFGMFKRFIKWGAKQKFYPLPLNFDDEMHKFTSQPKAVETWTDEQVIKALAGFTERVRLYALLCLNCGMTNVDIANLCYKPTYKVDNKTYSNLAWVDFEKGTITRSRIKTKRISNPPVTTYKLWPTTLELLKKHKADHETYVLTSMKNSKLVSKNKDLINMQWTRQTDKRRTMNLKNFRTVGATAVGSNVHYLPYRERYLANRPTSKGLTDRHYDAGTQSIMDEICDYLGRKFKQLK